MIHEKIKFVKRKFKEDAKRIQIKELLKNSWTMSWPMILVMFFEFVLSITDVYIAGLISKEVQAAVGLSSQIYSFFIMSGHAITIGTVAVIAKLFTSIDKQKYRQAVFTANVSAIGFGLVLGTLGVVFASQIVMMLNVPDEVKSNAATLLSIYSFGLCFHIVLINANAILRASKMMIVTLKFMSLTAVLNLFLNIYFIKYTELGFKGIAISTVISIFISFILSSKMIFKIANGCRSYSKQIIKQILSIGWPSGVVSISWQLGSTMLFAVIAELPYNSIEAMAAFTTGLRIESAIFMPAFAFNMANAVIVGNLIGEKRYDEAFKAGFATAFISVSAISALTFLVILNAKPIAVILGKNPLVISEIMKYLYICMVSEPFIALNLAMAGALNGAGDTKATMRYAVSIVWLVRLPLAYILGIYLGFGSAGIWWSLNIGLILHSMLNTRRFLSRKWQLAQEKL